jgi:predicted SprT family Zn-dependent metalloprotease
MTDFEITTKLHQLYNELETEFDFKLDSPLAIKISSRLRSSNGYFQCLRSRWMGGLRNCKIVMSKGLLDDFGWDRFEETFRHEVAHLADALNGRKGHGESFKRLCKQFGGTMNSRYAGVKYADCASAEYVQVIPKWIYTCPCGYQKKMTRRMAAKKRNNPRYKCGHCQTNRLDTWVEEQVG